ncbi:hypothetical protein ACLOJK_033310 [Asimina triloba]
MRRLAGSSGRHFPGGGVRCELLLCKSKTEETEKGKIGKIKEDSRGGRAGRVQERLFEGKKDSSISPKGLRNEAAAQCSGYALLISITKLPKRHQEIDISTKTPLLVLRVPSRCWSLLEDGISRVRRAEITIMPLTIVIRLSHLVICH